MTRTKRERSGFTLIELLVVIAIIAILAAILFPVFIEAKNAGKRAKCAANEKQLVAALLRYTDDNDGRIPTIYCSDDWGNDWWDKSTPPNWARAIYPYAKSFAIYRCPSAIPHVIHGNPRDPRNTGAHINTVSYLFNGMSLQKSPAISSGSAVLFVGKKMSSCSHPTKTIAIRELLWHIQMAQAFPSPFGEYVDYGGYYAHTDGANYCFFDGHIKYMKKISLKVSPSAAEWDFDDSWPP